jgi:hypothetical protein
MSTKRPLLEKFKARPLLIWRLVTYVVLGGMAASIIGSTYFIYTHIYQTLDSANAIVVLNSNMGSSILDLRAYQQTKAQLDYKLSVPELTPDLRNIFSYDSSTNPLPLPLTTSTSPAPAVATTTPPVRFATSTPPSTSTHAATNTNP